MKVVEGHLSIVAIRAFPHIQHTLHEEAEPRLPMATAMISEENLLAETEAEIEDVTSEASRAHILQPIEDHRSFIVLLLLFDLFATPPVAITVCANTMTNSMAEPLSSMFRLFSIPADPFRLVSTRFSSFAFRKRVLVF
jgi:hypothetical protein